MKPILLTKGMIAIVDDDDWELLEQYQWYYSTHNRAYTTTHISCKTENGKRTTKSRHIPMTHMILGITDSRIVDHKNGETLDNRKENLRICTNRQNSANSKLRKDRKSGYKGVSFNKNAKKWSSQIKVNYERIYLGIYDTPWKAAQAYDDAAVKYFGEFAKLNNVYQG